MSENTAPAAPQQQSQQPTNQPASTGEGATGNENISFLGSTNDGNNDSFLKDSIDNESVSFTEPDMTKSGFAWLNELSEDLQSSKSLQRFKSVDDLANSYLEAEKLARARNIQKAPGEDATSEEINAWRKHLGVPQDVSDYKLPDVINSMDEETLKGYFGEGGFQPILEMMHSQNLTQGQVDTMINVFGGLIDSMGFRYDIEETNRLESVKNNTINELKKEWGINFESNKNQVADFVSKFPGMAESLKADGLEYSLPHIRMIKSLIDGTGEASIKDTLNSSYGKSFAEAKADLTAQKNSGIITVTEFQNKWNQLFEDRANGKYR